MSDICKDFITRTKATKGTAFGDLNHYATAIKGLCPSCGKKVTQEDIPAIGTLFHKECLICSACSQIIEKDDLISFNDLLLHKNCYKEIFCERCAVCHDYIDNDIAINALSKSYHPDCFSCAKCGDKESVKVNFMNIYGKPYCMKCFRDIKYLFPLCVTCNEPVLPHEDSISFFFQGQKYFTHSSCVECSICHQIPETKDISIYKGKITCKKCLKHLKTHICAECNEPIVGPFATLENIFWHPQHFKCSSCGEMLQSGVAVLDHGALFCRICHHKQIKTCPKCGIKDDDVTLFACDHRWHKKCFTCINCRKDLSESKYINMNGNPLCKDCYIRLHAQGKIDRWKRLISDQN